MKKPLKMRNALSIAALSAALATAAAAPTAMAQHNESYDNVNNGWLSEYEGPTTGTTTVTNNRYRSVFGDNDTYGFIHNGWLSEYAPQPGDSMVAGPGGVPRDTGGIHRFERRLDWLGTGYWD